MTSINDLPTYAEMRSNALDHLSDAIAELRSDWRPGGEPEPGEGKRRVRAIQQIADAKTILKGREPEARDPEPPAEMAPLMEARAQGGHSPGQSVDTARTIEEAVRVLNYVTGNYSGEALAGPSDLYEVIGALKVAAQYMRQFTEQADEWLQGEHQAGRVACTFGRFRGDPDAAVHEAHLALDGARVAVSDLADALGDAHNAMAGLAGTE